MNNNPQYFIDVTFPFPLLSHGLTFGIVPATIEELSTNDVLIITDDKHVEHILSYYDSNELNRPALVHNHNNLNISLGDVFYKIPSVANGQLMKGIVDYSEIQSLN